MVRFRNACVLSAAVALSAGCLIGRTTAAEQNVANLVAPVPLDAGCHLIPSPPKRLETYSKYEQAIGSKSVIDEQSATRRRQALAPVEAAVRSLEKLTLRSGSEWHQARARTGGSCVQQTVETWAAAAALTEMGSKDANLARDKFMATVGETLLLARSQGIDVSRNSPVSEWLSLIARQTMEFYDLQAGPISRNNNHRYWAGLAIGRIGYLLGDPALIEWSRESFELGLCQIDADGFLPLEVARNAKAFDYHLYALVALRSLEDLLSQASSRKARCVDALPRLAALAERGEHVFFLRTSHKQDVPSRKNLAAYASLRARAEPEADNRSH